MLGLAPGATWVRWPSVIAVAGPGQEPRLIDVRWYDQLVELTNGLPPADSREELREALGPYAIEQATPEVDPVLLAAGQAKDRDHLGWLPDFLSPADETLILLEDLWARRRLWHSRDGAQPTLPGSSWYRHRAIVAGKAERVLLVEDPDGLSLALAKSHHVTVYEPEPGHRLWLQEQSRRLGVATSIEWIDQLGAARQSDIAVLNATDFEPTAAALAQAIVATRPGGHILVSCRSPADLWLYAMAQQAHLDLDDCRREVDHLVLPTGHVPRGAADLVLFRRGPQARLDPRSAQDPRGVASLPYLTLDFQSLAAERLTADDRDRWLDWLAALCGTEVAGRGHHAHGDEDMLWWYDQTGAGLLANVRPESADALVLLMPYSRRLEQAALCATFWLLADEHTGVRPRRTHVFSDQGIMS